MRHDSLTDWIVKMLLFVIFGPSLVALALQAFAIIVAMLVPLLVLLALIVGVSSGVSAALTLGVRGRRRDGEPLLLPLGPPLIQHRIRRPRGER